MAAARAAGPLEFALIMLMALTGVRVNEMCAANVRDLVEDQGVPVLQVISKGGHRAQVTVPTEAAAPLKVYLAGRRKGPLVLASGRSQPTIKALEQARIGRHRALYILGRLCERAGIPRITPHGLRHKFAGIGHDAAGDLLDLRTALGHAKPATTRR